MFVFHKFTDEEFDLPELIIRREREISTQRVWYIIEGVLFICLGLLAAFLPYVTALGVNILVGILLVLCGAFQIFVFMQHYDRWLLFLSGMVILLAGGLMLIFPSAGIMGLSILIGVFFLLEGSLVLVMAFAFRPFPAWRSMLFAGIVTLALGLLVFTFFPLAGMLYIAFFLAICFFSYGISILILALKCRKAF